MASYIVTFPQHAHSVAPLHAEAPTPYDLADAIARHLGIRRYHVVMDTNRGQIQSVASTGAINFHIDTKEA